MVQIPPRHGKSEFVSKHFAAWYLTLHPERFVMLGAYADALARGFSRAARDEYESWAPVIGATPLSGDVTARSDWQTAAGGGMFSAGVNGSFTGRGASIGIIDDPVKNFAEAQSSTVKESVWNWYKSSFYTRLTPTEHAIIIIMARWAEDDLAGRAIASWEADGLHYEVLDFPAIAEENDPLGRSEGDALWPEVGWTVERLAEVRRELGTRVFRALYQGRPSKGEGAVFQRKTFRYYTIADDSITMLTIDGRAAATFRRADLRVFQMVDLASTAGGGDYFVIGTFGITPMRDLIVLDVYRAQIAGPQQLGALWTQHKRWGSTRIGIESVAYQAAFVQAAIQSGLPAVEIKRKRGEGKEMRAYAVAARYEAGAVYHPREAAWLGDFEREIEDFPTGAHDDQVDVLADAGTVVMERGATGAIQSQGVRVG